MFIFLLILFFLWMLSLAFLERSPQHHVPAGLHSSPHVRQLHRRVREEQLLDLHHRFDNRIVQRHRSAVAAGAPAGYSIAKAKDSKAAVLVLIARMTRLCFCLLC
jgi:hypothetical protein